MTPRGLRATATAVAACLSLACAGCAVPGVPLGTLRVDGQPGEGVTVNGVSNAPDGRALAMTMSAMENTSASDSLTLVSALLVDPVGLGLVDSFSEGAGAQTTVGQPVPPALSDDDDRASARQEIANWKLRLPLSRYVLAPGEFRSLALVVRPTTSEPCVWAKGFSVQYEQFGHTYTVTSNMAMYVYSGKADTCRHVVDDLLAHPIEQG